MKTRKCPDCGCRRFYIKDLEDPFTIYDFDVMENGKVVFEEKSNQETVDLKEETEIYFDRCVRHDKLRSRVEYFSKLSGYFCLKGGFLSPN